MEERGGDRGGGGAKYRMSQFGFSDPKRGDPFRDPPWGCGGGMLNAATVSSLVPPQLNVRHHPKSRQRTNFACRAQTYPT